MQIKCYANSWHVEVIQCLGGLFLRAWLAISVIIKSHFDTGNVPKTPLDCCKCPSSPSLGSPGSPVKRPLRTLHKPVYGTTPLFPNKSQQAHLSLSQLWWELRSPDLPTVSPVTIKSNLSLNKKVTPYLLKLTMMKGNEDKGFSCRYQYKYYWKVN